MWIDPVKELNNIIQDGICNKVDQDYIVSFAEMAWDHEMLEWYKLRKLVVYITEPKYAYLFCIRVFEEFSLLRVMEGTCWYTNYLFWKAIMKNKDEYKDEYKEYINTLSPLAGLLMNSKNYMLCQEDFCME